MDYKALTFITLPFADDGQPKTYRPGDEIPRADFEANAENESAPDADDEIAGLIEGGALSDDPDAPIHPDNVIPDPSQPSMSNLVGNAQALVEEYEASGKDVPPELRQFADLDYQSIASTDTASAEEAT